MSGSSYDLAIVGGGVIGLTLARHMSQQGLSVVVLERNGSPAAEASQAGGGIISPLHPWRYSDAMLDLAAWSHNEYQRLASELTRRTGVYVPLINGGMLVPNVAEAEAALACDFLQAELLDAERVFQLEPGLATHRESVWVPEVNSVRNPALCKALIYDLELRKVEIKTSFEVIGIDRINAQFAISSTAEEIDAERVVIASGAWTKSFADVFGESIRACMPIWPDVFPVKGQMLAFGARLGVLRSVVLDQHRYLIPRHDGLVLVGSTVENADFDQSLTGDAYAELRDFATQTLPALAYYPVVSHWAGLRPGSHNDVPTIAAVPTVDGLYVSAGHFRNGLLSAPASAQLMGDIILGRESDFNISQYSL